MRQLLKAAQRPPDDAAAGTAERDAPRAVVASSGVVLVLDAGRRERKAAS